MTAPDDRDILIEEFADSEHVLARRVAAFRMLLHMTLEQLHTTTCQLTRLRGQQRQLREEFRRLRTTIRRDPERRA
jgi:hypothetical protein